MPHSNPPSPWRSISDLPPLDEAGRSEQVWLALGHGYVCEGYLVKRPRTLKAFNTKEAELDTSRLIAWAPLSAPKPKHPTANNP